MKRAIMGAVWALALAGAPVVARAVTLRPVFPRCTPADASGPNGMFCRPIWGQLIADNGEPNYIDLKDLMPLVNGGVSAYVVFGDGSDPSEYHQLFFDCRGHVSDVSNMVPMDAPPRSVGGQLARAACGRR